MNRMHVIIDTNVLFEGLTKQGGAAGWLIEAWLAGLMEVYASNALAYEYAAVLSRKLSSERWCKIQAVLGTLLEKTNFVTIYYSWRPASPDPGDDHVIDCALNAGAIVITSNVRDFELARRALGLHVVKPLEAVLHIVNKEA